VSALLLPPLGEGWDGGAEIARKAPVNSSLALQISAGFQLWVNPAQAPIPTFPQKREGAKPGPGSYEI
jgi:hypothetical protein